jgi:SAM-dependent methyltransferase
MPRDYDADPGRFLTASDLPQDDVHPYVAARLARLGVRTVLDVGGGNGRLARLLPNLGLRCLLLDISPAMLALAPRPAARADGARLPVASESVDSVAALFTLYHYDDPRPPIREARRVLRPGGTFAACAPNRDSAPEIAHLVPEWGAASPFDGEEAPDIVASVFTPDAGDAITVEWWDGPVVTLSGLDHAAGFLRVHGLSAEAARVAAASLDLPLPLTMRGCVVYATRAPVMMAR